MIEENSQYQTLKNSIGDITRSKKALDSNSFKKIIDIIFMLSDSFPKIYSRKHFLYKCGIFLINDGYMIDLAKLNSLLGIGRTSILNHFNNINYKKEMLNDNMSEHIAIFEDAIGPLSKFLKNDDIKFRIKRWTILLRANTASNKEEKEEEESDFESDVRGEWKIPLPVA